MAITLTTHTAYPSGFSRNGQSNDFTGNEELHAAPAAGQAVYLVHVAIQNGATKVTYTFKDATTVLIGPIELAINGSFEHRFTQPIKLTDAQALNLDASASSVGTNVLVEGFVK